ncbi:pp-loop domain protein [hydrocarbon metagenome]|uniref:Pp-loop domain protein n=1 Tax=hydrocarbon metagenome TaxID=938273 RepID=A0A0W8G5M5_9ZZZZ
MSAAPPAGRAAADDLRLQDKNPTYAQKFCIAKAGKLLMHTGGLVPGARVGVAVSGGVDSMVLLRVMRARQRIVPFATELMALHLNPGFDPENHAPLAGLCASLGLAAHIEVTDHGPRAHSPENRKNSPCFYCAWLRRKRLFELCRRYRLTHLAFGHNADDLAATFFMNLFQGGRVDGMSARESFFSGRLTVIRPLLLVDKRQILRASRDWSLPVWENPCPHSKRSKRLEIATWLTERFASEKKARTNVVNALRRWQLDKDAADR